MSLERIGQLEFGLEDEVLSSIPAIWTIEDIFEKANESLLRLLEEDSRYERKSARAGARALADNLSMWSNSGPNGGLIAVGIEKEGAMTGCAQLSQEQLNEIDCMGRTYCPDAKFKTRRVQVLNDKGEEDFIILVRVDYCAGKVVVTNSGKSFIRVSDQKHILTDDEVRELRNQKGEIALELELATINYPNDFDQDLIQVFIKAVRRKKELSFDHEAERILVQAKLGKLEAGLFRPNNACVLLFASDPGYLFPGCKIRFLRYEGEGEQTGVNYNVVKDVALEGPLPKLIVEAEKVISSQLREFSALGKDGRFYAINEYPKEAWYEAVVNACVHRSYQLRNMNIFVKMFDDRLVVESPGLFPPMVNPENIYSMHHPRNPYCGAHGVSL